jgi:phosphatidate cytidylyltransferase
MNAKTKSGFFVGAIFTGMFFLEKPMFDIAVAALLVMIMIELYAANRNKHKSVLLLLAYLTIPMLYIGFVFLYLVSELRWNCDVMWLITAVIGASSYDIMAFFVGSQTGRSKITPKISPNKTWEGTLGGFMGPFVVVTITGCPRFLNIDVLQSAILAVLIGISAFFGDLLESWYKRKLGLKDMANTIPGHGGILDRIDSHLLTIVGVYCFRAVV